MRTYYVRTVVQRGHGANLCPFREMKPLASNWSYRKHLGYPGVKINPGTSNQKTVNSKKLRVEVAMTMRRTNKTNTRDHMGHSALMTHVAPIRLTTIIVEMHKTE